MQRTATTAGDNYFATLKICVVTSFVLLVAASALHLPAWVAMLGGGAPLVYYHLAYLTPRATKGLSQAAIDSVYYFGFLVTVEALGVSAVSLALTQGKAPLDNIAFQFGLGLLATGYAVLARMHLTSISNWVDEASPEAVLDRYVQRSRELVTNVELASEQFVTLARNLMSKSEEVAKSAQMTTQTSMLEVARLFDEQLRGTLASARSGLTEIRGLVNETSFVQERAALVNSVKETLESVTALNKALNEFAQRSSEGARTSQEVTAASSALNDTLTAFCANLAEVGGTEGHMMVAAKSVAEANAIASQGTRALGVVVDELGQMTGTVSGLGQTFKNIKTLTLKASEQMEALVNSSERLDDATRNISRTAEASGKLADGLDRTALALPTLQERLEGLVSRFDGLKTAVANVEVDIQRLPRPASEIVRLGTEVGGALEAAARVLIAANADARSLAGNATELAAALERGNKAAADTAGVNGAAETLQRILDDLGAGVQRLQSTLDVSTTSLKTALGTATESLEKDVRRSTDIARVFGERMTDVAQIIIERTRDGRPA